MATTVRATLDRANPRNRSGFTLTQDYTFATAEDATEFALALRHEGAECEFLETQPTTTPQLAFRHFWQQAAA